MLVKNPNPKIIFKNKKNDKILIINFTFLKRFLISSKNLPHYIRI